MKTMTFARRCAKEILRDPLSLGFGLGFPLVLLALLVAQVLCVALGQNRATIHDRLAGTVVVDIASQKIFETTEDLIAYTKRIHAERAKRQDY